MKTLKNLQLLMLLWTFSFTVSQGQTGTVTGEVTEGDEIPAIGVTVSVSQENDSTFIVGAVTDEEGEFIIEGLKPGTYDFTFQHISFVKSVETVEVKAGGNAPLEITLKGASEILEEVTVISDMGKQNDFGRMPTVHGTQLLAGKKNSVVKMDKIHANLAVNNPRQVFSKVAGTNVWENDGSGIQLNIASRGLSPNRSWEYNVRQNGYDIAADIIGYPDHYYTPTMEAVEKIEVTRGAGALQYGTQLGGMVNMVMRGAPKGKEFEFVAKQTRGSYNLFNSYNSIGGNAGKFSYFGYYHHRSADGWRQNSDYNIHSGMAQFGYQVNKKLKLGFEYTRMNYLLHLSAGVTDAQFHKDPQVSNRERNWFQVQWNLPALTLDYDWGNGSKLSVKAYAVLSSRNSVENTDPVNIPEHNSFRDLRQDTYRNYAGEIKYLTRYNLFGGQRSTLLVGTRIYDGHTRRGQGWGTDGSDPNFNFVNPDSLEYNDYDFYTTNIAVFAENIFQITDAFSVTPGVRFENILLDFEGYYNDDGSLVPETAKHPRHFPLFGLGLQYQFAGGTNIYSNWSQGFRGINFNDVRVTNPNLDVDPDMEDSYGFNADLGIRGEIKQVINFDINAFYLSYNNKIGNELRMVDGGERLFRTNIADSRNMGVETYLEVDLIKAFKGQSDWYLGVFSSYAYVNSLYLNSRFKENRVEFAPEHIWKTGASLRGKNLSFTFNYSYISDQFSDANNTDWTESGNQGRIPAYTVLDFSGKYMIPNYGLALSVGVNNMLNNVYFTRRATSYPGPGIIPGEPTLWYVSVEYKFQK